MSVTKYDSGFVDGEGKVIPPLVGVDAVTAYHRLLTDTSGNLIVELDAGTNSIGILGANSGVDIGDVGVPALHRIVITEYPFGKGDLTASGTQYSDVVSSTTDAAVEVEEVTISPPTTGDIVEVEFGLSMAILAATPTSADCTILWRAKNEGGTYVTLNTTTHTDPGTAYVVKTVSGRFEPDTDFDEVPFTLSATIQRETGLGDVSGKTVNSSYVRVIYDTA